MSGFSTHDCRNWPSLLAWLSVIGVLCLLSLSASLAEEGPSNRKEFPGTCAYDVEGYRVLCFGADTVRCGDKRGWYYDFGDDVPSELDSREFRGRVAAAVYQWIDKLPEDERQADMRFYANTIKLLAEYRFPAAPGFTLLKYQVESAETIGFFVGYVDATERIYVLADGFKGSLRENFNRMLDENSGVFNLTPECSAKLLLRLKYTYTPLVVLDSYDDFVNSFLLFAPLFPPEEITRNERLYFDNIGADSAIMTYLDTAEIWEFTRWLLDEIDSLGIPDSIEINAPRVTRSGDSTLVDISLYSDMAKELANWRVVFNPSGRLLSMTYQEGPFKVQGTLDEVCTRSPNDPAHSQPLSLFAECPDTFVALSEPQDTEYVLLETETARIWVGLDSFVRRLNDSTRRQRDSVLLNFVQSSNADSDIRNITSFCLSQNFSVGEFTIGDCLRSGVAIIELKETGELIKNIRIHPYTAAGLCPVGGLRYCTPEGEVLLEYITWIS